MKWEMAGTVLSVEGIEGGVAVELAGQGKWDCGRNAARGTSPGPGNEEVDVVLGRGSLSKLGKRRESKVRSRQR